jgi:hypothetical protein
MIRSAPIVAALIGVSPALAETLTCSTWQQITTCQGPGGYVSHELHWQDRTIGQDNEGGKWTSWRWQDREITTVDRPPGWDGR